MSTIGPGAGSSPTTHDAGSSQNGELAASGVPKARVPPASVPLVSVCVPAFQAGRWASHTAESVLQQTYDNWELVVVDDASTDDTVEQFARFGDPRITVHRNPVRMGAVANWNRAVSLSQGEYVKVLCSDDVLRPSCLDAQAAVLRSDPTVALVACRRDLIAGDGTVVAAGRGLRGLIGRHDGAAVRRHLVRCGYNPIGEPSSVLFRRSGFDQVGGFDSRESYVVDLDMWARLCTTGAFYGMPEALATFRVHSGSWSAELLDDQLRQQLDFVRRLGGELPTPSRRHLVSGVLAAHLHTRLRALRTRRVVHQSTEG